MSDRFITQALLDVAEDIVIGYADNFDRRMAEVLRKVARRAEELEKRTPEKRHKDYGMWPKSEGPF